MYPPPLALKIKRIRLKKVESFFPSGPFDILDVGCGDGQLLFNNISKIGTGVGVDVNEKIISQNIKMAEEKGIRNLQFLKVNVEKEALPFLNDSFDILTMTAVIEHLINPTNLISEAKRVLRKKGILIITTPSNVSDKVGRSLAFIGLLRKMWNKHKCYYSYYSMKRLLHNIGFCIIRYERFSGWMNQIFIAKRGV